MANTSNVEVNGTTLACIETGQGDPVVLVHGSVSDLRTWSKQVPVLGERYRTIAYSRRYARPNPDIAPGIDDPMAVHVEDLAALIRTLDAVPAHVAGHSWGGFVVLMCALKYPDLLRSMVLMEPPLLTLAVSDPPRPMDIVRLFFRQPAAAVEIVRLGFTVFGPVEKAFRAGDDRKALEIFGNGVLGREYFGRLGPDRYQQVWDNRSTERAHVLGENFPPLDEAELRALDIPTLMLTGADSPKAFHLVAAAAVEMLGAEAVVIANASHIMHEDAPDATNSAMLDFLDRQ